MGDGLPDPALWRNREGGARAWMRIGAAVGLIGGPVACAVGTAILAVLFLVGDGASYPVLHAVGTTLVVSLFPLLIFGAYCLDRLEDCLGRAEAAGEQAPGPRDRRGPVRRSAAAVLGAGLIAASAMPARAQQTIFNVPSTDVLPQGKVYFELDSTWKPVEPRFSSFVPRVVVGTGGNVEVGLNVTGNITPGDDVTTLQPAFKWKAYDGGDNGWAVVLGDNVSIPVRNKPFDVGNYAYAQASKAFPTGTRLTFGGYHFSEDVVAPGAQRAGGQFGFEQTVTPWLNVNADWFTGKHAAGYFTPGVAFKPHPRVTGYVGYSVGNTGAGNGNHFFYTAVGINLN